MKAPVLALPLLLLGGCAVAATNPEAREYRGYFERGFETEAFHPCGSRDVWWVTDAVELRQRYAAATTRAYEPVFVVVRGDVGPEGRYGHLGAYTRELSVSRVLDLKPAGAGSCE